MGNAPRRLLLADSVDGDAVDRFAGAQGWSLVNVYARREGRPWQAVYATSDGTALITLVEDHRIAARYLVVDGHDPDGPLDEARASLPHRTLADVRAAASEDPARALCWLGVIGPAAPTDEWRDLIRAGLAADEERVRDAALFAAEALGWPGLDSPEPSSPEPGLPEPGLPEPGSPEPGSPEPGSPEPGEATSIAPAFPSPGTGALPLPERPRLASRVQARIHVVDGERKVVLTDASDGLVAEIDPGSWTALTLADGTRDRDALALACARAGVHRSRADLHALLAALNEAGLLVDGLALRSPPPPVAPAGTSPDRPLEPLEGFTLVCDGSGSCCRFYGSVPFTRREAMRAELWSDTVDVRVPPEQLFSPLYGAQLDPDAPRAIALVDGCCAFLEGDGRCGLHRRGGPSAKPLPCRLYPATLVDDGEGVRVSAAPECACVFASDGRRDGAPLVPAGARHVADLGPDVPVMHLPDPVPLTRHRPAPRPTYRLWATQLAEGLREASSDPVDLVLALADVVEARGLDLAALAATLDAPPRARPATVRPWIDALRERAAEVAAREDRWRSASDLSRRVARQLADALGAAELPALLEAPPDAAAERFYLRALAHGHRLAIEGRPLVDGLRDRAARLVAARAMAARAMTDRAMASADEPEAAPPYPLALVEAAMRNLGLRVEPPSADDR